MNSIDNCLDANAIQITEMMQADIESVLEILADNKLESWSFDDFVSELSREGSLLIVAKTKLAIIGFCIARLIKFETNPLIHKQELSGENKIIKEFDAGDCEIYNIAVKREHQNAGIGCQLLNYLVSVSRIQSICSVWLEVRKSNYQAVSFYEKNGFIKIYERNNFYANPVENAIVMKKTLR